MYFLIIVAGIYVLGVGLVYLFLGKIVFLPVPLKPDYSFNFEHEFEEVNLYIEEENSLLISSLFFPIRQNEKGIILYLHGNADNLQRWGQYSVDFTLNQYSVLAIDYPTYGKSIGDLTEENIYLSAEMAYEWVRERYEPSEIIIYGRSLGCAPASYLASRNPAQKLILETPFYSMPDVLKIRYPWIFLFEPPYSFPNYQYLDQVPYEKWIFQGTADEVVPFNSAVKLKPLLDSPDHFIVIEGGKHKNLREFPEYHEVLKNILQ